MAIFAKCKATCPPPPNTMYFMLLTSEGRMVFVGLLESRMVEWEWGYPTTMCAPGTSYSYAVRHPPPPCISQLSQYQSWAWRDMHIMSREMILVVSEACYKTRGESLLRGGLMYTSRRTRMHKSPIGHIA